MGLAKFIAQDYGAGSGRTMLGTVGDTIQLEEIHRFPNHQIQLHGHYYWDILRLFMEFKEGLTKAAQKGHRDLMGVGVDTWGVDFGLLAEDGSLLGNPVCYRDPRTDWMMEKAFSLMPREEIYSLTGLQFMQLNTIFQLFSMALAKSPILKHGHKLLFTPDLFNYFMTGKQVGEYTIASTSQLLNAKTKRWAKEIFDALSLPIGMMPDLVEPGSVVGPVLPEILQETGVNPVDILAVGCHDTASAVAAVPAKARHWAYLSSGTWSLIGIEVPEPIISEESLNNNFTNEGGVGQTIRFLKNLMGMWLFEGCIRTWRKQGDRSAYEDYILQAEQARPFIAIVDPDDHLFLNPPDMVEAILAYCEKHRLTKPQTKGEFVRVIFESLAMKYKWVIEMMNEMTGHPVEVLHIVGGGCQNQMLNQFAANATGIPVMAGPIEATAMGNVMVQAISKQIISSISEGREIVARSFNLIRFDPESQNAWNEAYEKYKSQF